MLRPCWQWCANGCNNSQQCWDLQSIVGRIEPVRLWRWCVMYVRGLNNVGRAVKTYGSNVVPLSVGDHETKEMLGVVGSNVWPVSNFAQLATTCNRVCKRTQHVTPKNVGSRYSNVASVCTELKYSWKDFSFSGCFKSLGWLLITSSRWPNLKLVCRYA